MNAAEAAEDVIEAVDYLKTRLDAGEEVFESAWMDSLMSVHGYLLELAELEEKP